jgi:hypothetical protein
VAASVPRQVRFTRPDPQPLVEIVAALDAAHRGWVNVAPDLGDDQTASQRGGWFSARGPAAPHATYLAGRVRRGGRADRAQLGIEHASGTKAARRLAEGGHAVPSGWVVRQDHPKRGLVVEVPSEEPARSVVGWLLEAAVLLSRVPLGERWVAEVWDG